MLEHTFCHVQGIGTAIERRLWGRGLSTWEDVLAVAETGLDPKLDRKLRQTLGHSRCRLAVADLSYFYRLLPSSECWRLFPHFRHRVAYFDIETTGLHQYEDYITTIVLYDGNILRHYVRGKNLEDFAADVECYDLLVTYNGKTFDVPFVRRHMDLPLRQAHIDLRYVLRSLGFRGGLKSCERQLGLIREGVEQIDGFFGVVLWFDYHQNGNEKALETLLAYNAMDVVNLELLMVLAYERKLRETPFADRGLPAKSAGPAMSFRPDPETIKRLRAGLP